MGASLSGQTENVISAEKGLTTEEVKDVKASWVKVAALGSEEVGVLLFKEIFRLAPDALSLFSFKDLPQSELYKSRQLKNHGKKVVDTVGAAVGGLHDLPSIVPVLQSLGVRHAHLGLEEAHFKVVGEALINTLALGLGESFTPSLKKAWVKVYVTVQTVMLGAMADVNGSLDEKLKSGGA